MRCQKILRPVASEFARPRPARAGRPRRAPHSGGARGACQHAPGGTQWQRRQERRRRERERTWEQKCRRRERWRGGVQSGAAARTAQGCIFAGESVAPCPSDHRPVLGPPAPAGVVGAAPILDATRSLLITPAGMVGVAAARRASRRVRRAPVCAALRAGAARGDAPRVGRRWRREWRGRGRRGCVVRGHVRTS